MDVYSCYGRKVLLACVLLGTFQQWKLSSDWELLNGLSPFSDARNDNVLWASAGHLEGVLS